MLYVLLSIHCRVHPWSVSYCKVIVEFIRGLCLTVKSLFNSLRVNVLLSSYFSVHTWSVPYCHVTVEFIHDLWFTVKTPQGLSVVNCLTVKSLQSSYVVCVLLSSYSIVHALSVSYCQVIIEFIYGLRRNVKYRLPMGYCQVTKTFF